MITVRVRPKHDLSTSARKTIMSELLKQQRQAPSLKLIEILEDGSAKTFIYEDPEKKHQSSFISRIKAKIQQKLRPSAN